MVVVRAEVLREFVSKRHAMVSRVVIAAADDEEDVATATDGKAAHRRRHGSHGCDAPSAPESDSALAKVRACVLLRWMYYTNPNINLTFVSSQSSEFFKKPNHLQLYGHKSKIILSSDVQF